MQFASWLSVCKSLISPRSRRQERRFGKHRPTRQVAEIAGIRDVESLEDRLLLSAAPQLLDINTAPSGASSPAELVNVNGLVFFRATDAAHGQELWRTDGTAAGTVQVRDINPGSESSVPTYLANHDGTLLFKANDGVHGAGLWRSDGTAGGTTLVKNVNLAGPLVNVNGVMFFTAEDGVTGAELWKTDGTTAGTLRVKDIRPGTAGSSPIELVNVNGTLFFTANDGANGRELWKSDGTEGGTVLVRALNNDANEPDEMFLTNLNGTLFFVPNGDEVWKSDGTFAGTSRVTNIRPDAGIANADGLVNVNGTLFFRADDGTGVDLWMTDGTPGSECPVDPGIGNVNPHDSVIVNRALFITSNDQLWRTGIGGGSVEMVGVSAHSLMNVNGTLYFQGNEGGTGFELWKSDETATEVAPVIDLRPGTASSHAIPLLNVDGLLFFSADDGVHGQELWVLGPEVSRVSIAASNVSQAEGNNGLTAFTLTVTRTAASNAVSVDFAVAGSGANPANAADFGGVLPSGTITFAEGETTKTITLSVSGDSMVEPNEDFTVTLSNSSVGTALDTSSATGTILNDDFPVVDIMPQLQLFDLWDGALGSGPKDMMNVNGTLFFVADRGAPLSELWRTDGTPEGTTMIKDHVSGGTLTNVNGTLFFQSENPGTGWELWKSDGTAAGTSIVKDIAAGSANSVTSFIPMTNVNGTLFFGADSGGTGYELWKSDGTEAGTILVKDIVPGSQSSYPEAVATVNGTLYFKINDGASYPLWKSDGTEAGTVFVEDVSAPRSEMVQVGDTTFLTFKTGVTGTELWKIDGAATEPVLVKDLRPGSGDSTPRSLTNVNGTLFFSAYDGTGSAKLWKSDGTEAGTTVVADINPTTNRNNPNQPLANVGGTLFFTSGDALWKTDGTAAGTALLKSSNGFRPGHLTSFDGLLYFTANDGQLWRSNGTPEGTVLAYDVRPDSSNSDQERLIAVGENLFFTANDGSHGQELFVLHAGPEPAILSIAPTNAVQAEGSSGNTALTFTVTRSGDASDSASVDFVVSSDGQNAADAGDFGGTLPSGTINFAAGETAKVVTINVSGDLTFEPDESFIVTLTNPSGAFLDTTSATGTIRNDDRWLTVTPTNISKSEGQSGTTTFTFTVTRAGSVSDARVDFVVSGSGSHPADAADFGSSLPSGTARIYPGETTTTFTINVRSDVTLEPSEEFTVTFPYAYDVDADVTLSPITGVILDDDRPLLRVGVDPSGNLTLIENGNGGADRLTVTLDSATSEYVISSPANSLTTDDITATNTVRIAAAQVTGGLLADLGGGDDQLDLSALPSLAAPVTVRGGSGNDTLIGSAGNDLLDGGDGDDNLSGGAGDDSLVGGGGSDKLFGGSGLDVLDGGAGNDLLRGQGGLDTLTGGAGNDTLDGGGGKDVVRESGNTNFTLKNTQLVGVGGWGTDKLLNIECAQLTGGSGNNTLDASAFTGSVTLDGGDGYDDLIGGSGNDLLVGGGHRDSLVGNGGRDTLQGGLDGDTLIGGVGNDLVEGGEGDDLLSGNAGNDTLRGGAGNDSLSERGNGTLVLTDNSLVGLGVDVLEQFETLILSGNVNANRLDASAATLPVVLKGGGGNDTLIGGSNQDKLLGGDGNDLIFGNGNHDRLYGNNGDDSLAGDAGNDLLFGDSGADFLIGNDGTDTLHGNNGTAFDAGDLLHQDTANEFHEWLARL